MQFGSVREFDLRVVAVGAPRTHLRFEAQRRPRRLREILECAHRSLGNEQSARTLQERNLAGFHPQRGVTPEEIASGQFFEFQAVLARRIARSLENRRTLASHEQQSDEVQDALAGAALQVVP